jgi:uncharacterized protein (DUF1330 family)
LECLEGAAVGTPLTQTRPQGEYAPGPVYDAFGGKYVIRTENITALDGTPPKRFIVIAFDRQRPGTLLQQKEIVAIRAKFATARSFIADGTIN